jgi:uncharacterized membrane protein YraQ (UPF0718 family)
MILKLVSTLKKMSGSMKFLLLVMGGYLCTGYFHRSYTEDALQRFGETLINVAPVLMFVFTVMFLINIFVKPAAIKKHLGSDSGIKGWMYAILGSILIAAPPYILFPFFGELQKQGMKSSLIVIFLSNRNVQPPFIPVMIYYFGTPFTVVISVYILIFAVINGLVLGKMLDKH